MAVRGLHEKHLLVLTTTLAHGLIAQEGYTEYVVARVYPPEESLTVIQAPITRYLGPRTEMSQPIVIGIVD